jgi:plastocyanin domain-containing protein
VNEMAPEQPVVEEGPEITIQLDGGYTDGVYTVLARVPGVAEPDEPEPAPPLAEIKLSFHEDVADEVTVGAMINTFLENVDAMLTQIDEVIMLDQEADSA